MKKFCLALALAGTFVVPRLSAISLDDVQFWTGSGTNRAALIIEWSPPVAFNQTLVPPPVTTKTMVWGYRFNGTATGTEMFNAIVAADRRLYAVETIDPTYGPSVDTIGYNLSGNGQYGVTDGTNTYHATNFVNGLMVGPTLVRDAAVNLNAGDLYWSGHYGPNWVQWSESNYSGGFSNSPNRGTSPFYDTNTFAHGEWWFGGGLKFTTLFDGSWMGFSVAAAGYPTNLVLTDEDIADIAIYDAYEQAPPGPDGNYTAYVYNTNDFAVQISSTNNVFAGAPYNDPIAMLGRPTLKFLDHFGDHTAHRSKIIEPPYWTTPQSNNVLTEINSNGQVTVNMGRKIYDDPGNPYGVDFIVYGNSFFSASGISGFVGDGTDLGVAKLSSGFFGHSATISVSQDGVTWYSYSNTPTLFPDNAYRWDNTNHAWTDEELNPTKPIDPSLYSVNFGGQKVAAGLDQFMGAAGGTGFDLKASGYPWIQYVRVEPAVNTYTVIDAIAAVNPVDVGDALVIAPTNLSSGITNLAFEKPDRSSNTLVSLNFALVSDVAKISTISLSEFSSFAPVIGSVSSAYQITAKPLTNTTPVSYVADVGLRAGDNYTGNGTDLRIYQWQGTNWTNRSFTFNPLNKQAVVSGVTNLSAFVVAQIVPPQVAVGSGTNSGTGFQFTPVPNCANILERSIDLVTWTPILTNTPSDSQPITLQDSAPPADGAYYRIHITLP